MWTYGGCWAIVSVAQSRSGAHKPGTMELAQLDEFKELGYTVLRGVHDQHSMAGWRSTQDYLESTTLRENVSALCQAR
eukprot:COSAG02_NODE_15815_length_1139_cov_1.143269_2_plen_78_part_00